MIALPTHLTQIRDLPVDESLAVGTRPVEEPGDAGGRQLRVMLGLERGKLLATHLRAAARHHDRSVPAQERHCATEGVQPAKLLLELLVRGW